MVVHVFQKGTSIAVVRTNMDGTVSLFRTFSTTPTDKVVNVGESSADPMEYLRRAQPLKGNVSPEMTEALTAAVNAAIAWEVKVAS